MIQSRRLEGTGQRSNAKLDRLTLEAHATPDASAQALLLQAADAMKPTARGYTRNLRISRTTADLVVAANIGRVLIAEALSYRRRSPQA